MRDPLIGKILEALHKAYESGDCDNISSEERESILVSLSDVYNLIATKQDKVLTIEETSKYLNCTRQTVRNYVKEGKLKPKKHLGGVLEFKLREIKNLIQNFKRRNNGL